MLKKIATNTFAQILAKFLTAFVSIILIKVLTNYLDIAGYGLYSKIYNYLGIFAFLADLGLYTISIREISRDFSSAEKVVGNVLTLRTILGILIIFVAIIVALFLPGYNSQIALISIFIVGIFTLFGLINSSIMALMQANLKAEFSLVSTVLGKIINIGLIVFLVFVLFPKDTFDTLGFPFICIMLAGLLGNMVMVFANFLYARKICPIKYHFDYDYIKYIFKISLPYGLALFLSMVYFKVDVILLSIMQPMKIADISVALYSVPMKIIEVLMVLSGFFLNSMLPSFTKYFKDGDGKKVTSIIKDSLYILFGAGFGIFLCGLIFKNDIIKIVSNEQYLNTNIFSYTSADAFGIALLAFLFYVISNLFIYLMIATDNQKKLLNINIVVTIFNILGNILLIPKFSFMGAVFITALSQIILLVITFLSVKKYVKIEFNIGYFLSLIFLGIILWFLGKFLLLNFPLHSVLNVFLYGGIIFILYCIPTFFIYKKFIK